MFPDGEFDDSRLTARDVAVEDSNMPDKFWLTDMPGSIGYEEPEPLRIHKVGQVAPGMGPSRRPNAVQSHDGIILHTIHRRHTMVVAEGYHCHGRQEIPLMTQERQLQ